MEAGMTELFLENNRGNQYFRLWPFTFILLFLPLLAHSQQADRIKNEEASMNNNRMTLWKLIESLSQQVPFTREKIEYILAASLPEREQNEHIISFHGKDIQLADQVVISNIELRLNEKRPTPGFLVIDINGKCISLQQLQSHYGMLEITEAPRGRSLDEATTYSASFSWGALSFGFKESNPQCLSFVVLDPSNPKKK